MATTKVSVTFKVLPFGSVHIETGQGEEEGRTSEPDQNKAEPVVNYGVPNTTYRPLVVVMY
jgi:hypothetical protein